MDGAFYEVALCATLGQVDSILEGMLLDFVTQFLLQEFLAMVLP